MPSESQREPTTNRALPRCLTPITTMVAQYCPSCSHHEDYRRPCLTQHQLQCPCLDVVQYDRPCPVSSTMPTMSECPTLKYSQPWVNTSQPSSCRLAQCVPSLHHRCRVVRTEPCRRVKCYRSRKRRTDTRSVKVNQRGNTALPPPPATCLRALSGRAGEKACAGCRLLLSS
ncbi:hypothetical protein EV363DRAFT_1323962 [Boletus edulis]|nr:hypothetical protein EV363DRAFT_1323962 [Boletus edulis]